MASNVSLMRCLRLPARTTGRRGENGRAPIQLVTNEPLTLQDRRAEEESWHGNDAGHRARRLRRSPPRRHPTPTWLAGATDDELAATFRSASTLPLDNFMNAGGHIVDLATRTIFNDEHWKGWLPRGLALRDIFTRLATGYAKRFWKQGNRFLGETLYLDGSILVKHSLEEFTLDRPTNDLDPGPYILLRYTDPVFEHLFYDVMRAGNDGVIVYGGYTGKFPDGSADSPAC